MQVKNLNAEQQLEVLSRLRDFLVNHYDFILFGDAVWGRIIVLLDGSKSSRRDFSLQTVEGFRVIGIPPKFHMRELVDFIHKSIPETAPGFYEAQRAAEL